MPAFYATDLPKPVTNKKALREQGQTLTIMNRFTHPLRVTEQSRNQPA